MIKHWRIYLLGLWEGWQGGDLGMTYDNDPTSPRSEAYDRGYTHGRRLRGLE